MAPAPAEIPIPATGDDEALPPGLPADVYFYVPVARSPDGLMVLSFEHARAAAASARVVNYRISEWDHLSVDIATKRELAADRFLREHKDCQWMLMVDDDMDFRVDVQCLTKLMLAALKSDSQIIGPLMVRRDIPHWVAYNEVRGKPDDTLQGFKAYKENRIVPLTGHMGTGCILIHRSVFEKVPQPWFQTITTRRCQLCMPMDDAVVKPDCEACKGTGINPTGTWVAVGEDAFFCRKAIDAGFKCSLAAGVLLAHVGKTPFTIQDSIRHQFPDLHASAMLKAEDAKKAHLATIPELALPPGVGHNGKNRVGPPAEILIASR